tara:strand:+ start:829 stop:1785 length:957 start_codon:yes stop_codon:yes gene_type:complete
MHTDIPLSLALVSPCFNEESLLEINLRKLIGLLEKLSDKQLIDFSKSSIYVVDDGSKDGSWEKLKTINSTFPQVKCIKLSRNFGHQNALLSGILQSTEDIVVTIDIDLQDDLDAIEKMILEFLNGFDIVYGVKKNRNVDGFLKNFFATWFYFTISLLGAEVIKNHADFRLLSRRSIDALREFKEFNIYLRGIIPKLGFKSTQVEYVLRQRENGESKYIYKKSLSLALKGITSFSLMPLRIIGMLGFFIAFASILITLYFLFESIFTDKTIPGWASTVLPIYFLGAVQLISLGVLSEYIGHLFLESKKRPNYIIEDILK